MRTHHLAPIALTFAIGVVALSGCTSLKLVENTDESRPYAGVAVGDRIRVLDHSGVATDFEVTVIGMDFVEGETRKRGAVRIAFADVEELQERQISWGKTALLGVGVGYLAAAAAAAAALASLF